MLFTPGGWVSDSQRSETAKDKQSANPPNTLKPLVRACESCRARKVRCLPEDSTKCQRCFRSGRQCVYTPPEKKRRRKRTDTRVAELEHMVQMLATRLEEEQRARTGQNLDRSPSSESQGNDIKRRPSQSAHPLDQPSPTKQESLPQGPAQYDHTSSAPSLSQHQSPGSSATKTLSLPSVTGKPADPSALNHHPPSPASATHDFGPLPSLDYTERSTLPASLQVEPWPTCTAYPNLSSQQASWQEDLYSTQPSPSQSVSLDSAASSQIDSWPSPATEHDFAASYPGNYPPGIDDKTHLPFPDPRMWWLEPDFLAADPSEYYPDLQALADPGNAQLQPWDFPCTQI